MICGCSSVRTQKAFYEPITSDLREGEFEAARLKLEKAREKNKFAEKDRFVYYLDAGLANYYAGNYDTSIARLNLAENTAEDLYTKSIRRAAASMLLNDNVLEYAGEDYETLYANLIKALAYLALNETEDAFIEVRRANLKMELLEQKYAEAEVELNKGLEGDSSKFKIPYDIPDIRFNNTAFARYLGMHLYATEGDFDNARVAYEYLQKAFILQPEVYDFPMPDVEYYKGEEPILSLVALAGLSPVKEDWNLRIRTDKQLDLVTVFYEGPDEEDIVLSNFYAPISEDYYFKMAVPTLEDRISLIDKVIVRIDNIPMGEMQIIEDVGNVARHTFEAKFSMILVRSVIRTLIKGLAAHEAKAEVKDEGVGGWLLKAAIDVGTDLIENADLRCSRLLPDRIYVMDIPMQPGVYNIAFDFLDEDGNLLVTKDVLNYRVYQKGLNLVQAFSLK